MANLRSILIVNSIIGLGMAALNSLFAPPSSLRELWTYIAANMIYSQVIGSTAAFVVPRIAVRLWCRRGPRMWFPYVATLIAVAAAGTLLAVVALWICQIIPAAGIVAHFRGSIHVATIITLIIGIAAYFIESLRHKGEAAALALKQQQLLHQRAQTLASEARFSSLQSRLQPHFLFNTINSILALIREDPAGAEQMLQRLARLLRYALDSQQRSTVPLGDELTLVTDYLEIERTRFGPRLRYAIDVPAALREWLLPPYALQTLIENSMKYVIGARREGGAITLSARREAGLLHLEVRDDGAGFSLDAIPAGHGLDTLIQRLQMLYQESATLTVEALHPGCAVRLTLPGETA